MCGRYTLFKLEQLLNLFPWLKLPTQVRPRYNIAPTQPVLALADETPTQLDYFHWGLIPSWAKDRAVGSRMINARAETLAAKPAFRALLRTRRCLVPADGFYEWRREPDGSKTPMYVRMKSAEPFMLAGLWDRWHDPTGGVIRSCTLITTTPNTLMQDIHDRMPVIVPPDRYQQWLEGSDAAPLLQSFPAEQMEAYPVSRRVNKPANDAADCVEAITSPI
jgi:putative SOS response-associated peptidase YedK